MVENLQVVVLKENPVFSVWCLVTCPTLAVSNKCNECLRYGSGSYCCSICSNLVISACRKNYSG
ncbi:MAG: Rnf-Nqr domain containing protein [Eubacteriales bacterium]